MAIKPTPQQAAKLKRGKLLNQRFRFKKDEEETGELRGFSRFYKKEEADAINKEGLRVLDELKNIGAMSGIDVIKPVTIEGLEYDYEKISVDEFETGEVDYETLCDNLDKMDEGEDEPDMDGAIEPKPVNISLDGFPHLKAVANAYKECTEPHVNVLRARYDELVTELAMVVSDRIKSFKKRSIVMAKITGEEYGFLEESCWSTSETTTFKYWPASWKFERCIGTNTIFEARFHHTTFELLSYCTVFAYDPKTVITRNPNKYSLDNDDDLLAIISIYEKAIAFVYSKGEK